MKLIIILYMNIIKEESITCWYHVSIFPNEWDHEIEKQIIIDHLTHILLSALWCINMTTQLQLKAIISAWIFHFCQVIMGGQGHCNWCIMHVFPFQCVQPTENIHCVYTWDTVHMLECSVTSIAASVV